MNLSQVIQSHIDNFETQCFTSLPATIVSFDSETQTASVKPVMLEPYTDGLVSEFAQIDYVPVMFPSAGGGSLTFPVQKGDEVLLTFSSRSFDTWWGTGETGRVSSSQRYNTLTDAIAHIGITSSKSSLKASTENVELSFKDTKIKLTPDNKVSIGNDKEELLALFDELITTCKGITVDVSKGTLLPTTVAQLTTLQTRLALLKE